MSEPPSRDPDADAPQGRQPLRPRPIERPRIDPEEAATFGRPGGLSGAFDRAQQPPSEPAGAKGSLRWSSPPAEALRTAFGKPAASSETLQRPPRNGSPEEGEGRASFWSEEGQADPWRDPGAGAVLGPPAAESEAHAQDGTGRAARGALLSVPELLFGRRVKPTALLALLLAALLVGAAGGAVGWLAGRGGGSLTDGSVTLAQVDPGVQRAPNSVAAVARRVTPAVVSLEVKAGKLGAVGSGVVIDGEGYVLTNNHVVAVGGAASPKITAVFTDGTRAPASIVGTDPKTDVAVVKVHVSNPTVIKLGKSSSLRVGDPVIAIGSPLGLASTVTSGIVSAKHRAITAAGENGGTPVVYDAIQTDAAINHGNSGGALVNSSGALVGINSAISSSSQHGGSIGLGFAIPIDQARTIAQALIRNGKVTHASLGVNVRSVSANSSEGAQVANVPKGGAAAKAGIAEGDVITKFGNRLITNAAELQAAVLEHTPGDKVGVRVVRHGVRHTVQVTLGSG